MKKISPIPRDEHIQRSIFINPNPSNVFFSPPPSTQNQFSDSQAYTDGTTLNVAWSNNSSSFNVVLNSYSTSAANERSGFYDILTDVTNFTQSFDWVVSTQGLPSAEMYNMEVVPTAGEGSNGDFLSQYFKISANKAREEVESSPSLSTSSAISPASALQSSVVITTKSSSTVSTTSTSSALRSSAVTTISKVSSSQEATPSTLSSTATSSIDSTSVSRSISNSDSTSTSSSKSTSGSTSTAVPLHTSTPASHENSILNITLGIVLGVVLLNFGCWIFWFLYKRWRTKKLQAAASLSDKERALSEPCDLEGMHVELTPPAGESLEVFRQPIELDGGPSSPVELNSGLREPVELDGKALESENTRGRSWMWRVERWFKGISVENGR